MAAYPWEFNGVVRLTKVGTTYIVSTVVLAVAAVNTGNNALYIAVSVMLGCLLLSGVASKDGLKLLDVEIRDIDEAWAGKPANGTLVLRNRSGVWNVRDVVLTSPAFVGPILVPLIRSGQEIALTAPFVFPRRGLAHVSVVDSYTRYPFGFFLKKRRLRVESEVVVYPALLDDESTADRFRASIGESSSASRLGPGSEIHSFREYVRGDSLRQVHWKKSASLGRWIMKQPAADTARAVHVVVDPFRPRGVSEEAFEMMISSAATYVHGAVRRGFDVTLALPRVTIHSRAGEPGSPLYRALALVEASFEPVHQILERDAVLFSLGGDGNDAKSA